MKLKGSKICSFRKLLQTLEMPDIREYNLT